MTLPSDTYPQIRRGLLGRQWQLDACNPFCDYLVTYRLLANLVEVDCLVGLECMYRYGIGPLRSHWTNCKVQVWFPDGHYRNLVRDKGIDCDLENTMTVVSPKDETCVSLHPGDFQVQESRPAAGLLRLGILVELASHGGLFSCEVRRLSNRLTALEGGMSQWSKAG